LRTLSKLGVSSPNDETSAKRNEVCDREFCTKTPVINDPSPEISPRVKNGGLFVFLLIFTFIIGVVSDIVAICYLGYLLQFTFHTKGFFFLFLFLSSKLV
jgi:hypothetical protein